MSKEKGIEGRKLSEDEILAVLKGDTSTRDNRSLCLYGINRARCNDKPDGNDCKAEKPYDCKHYDEVTD